MAILQINYALHGAARLFRRGFARVARACGIAQPATGLPRFEPINRASMRDAGAHCEVMIS